MDIIELKNQNEINSFVDDLQENNIRAIVIDIEAEFNLHCYGEHLCLIQIFDGNNKIIIDPFKFKSKASFKAIFEKRDILKVMYDSSSDSLLLENTCHIMMNSILDLRPAVSLLEYEKQSLSNILNIELGHEVINKKKFQRYNWMRRPISPEAMEYAMNDVIHLLKLKDVLLDKLIENNLLDEFFLRNLMIQPCNRKRTKREKYKNAKGYSKLTGKQKKLFKELFEIREDIAKKLNKPPNNIFNNKALLELCNSTDNSVKLVEQGMGPGIHERSRSEINHRFFEKINSLK